MAVDDYIAGLVRQATGGGPRSSVLKPLDWLLGMLLLGALGAFGTGAPSWLGVGCSVGAGATTVTYLITYICLVVVDRDALRSEPYSLTKLAIEKRLLGDSTAGIIPERAVRKAQGEAAGSDAPGPQQ